MVILNKNEETKTIETGRYNELLKKFKTGKEVISGEILEDLSDYLSGEISHDH